MKCRASPGFIQLHADEIVEEPPAPWTEEGTRAHEIAALLLNGKNPEEELQTSIPAEMMAHAQAYASFVKDKMSPQSQLIVESKVPLFYMKDRNGMVDAAVMDPGTIYIPDFKYGVGVVVEATNNEQLAIYGLSLIKWLMDAGMFEFSGDTLVTLAIFQPRARSGPTIKLWALKLTALIEFCNKIEATATSIIAKPLEQPFFVSDDTCRFCLANAICTERTKYLLGELPATVSSQITFPDVATLTPLQMVRVLEVQKPLEKFMETVRKHVFALLSNGEQVAGVKLVSGNSSRSWKDEKEAEEILKKAGLKKDEIYPAVILSVAAAEKALKKAEAKSRLKDRFEKNVTRTEGKPTLVTEDDPRQAIDLNPTKEFQNLDAKPVDEDPSLQ